MSYNVATQSNAALQDYLTWDVAWFFHGSADISKNLGNPLRHQQYNYDWESIADLAVAAGNVSAACTHAIDQAGYRWFWSGHKLPLYSESGTNYPLWDQDYGIQLNQTNEMNYNHLWNFVKSFRSRGIKVGFYINTGQCNNLFNNNQAGHTSAASRECWVEYLHKEIKWLKALYQIDFWWVDFEQLNQFSVAQREKLYQVLRAPNGALVIKNSWMGMGSFKFPGDIKHVEFHGLPADEDFWLPETTISTVDYYIPSGLAYSGLYSVSNVGTEIIRWNPFSQTTYSGDSTTYNQVRDQATFNTWYTYAKDRSVPFFVNVPVIDNDIPATYLSRLQNLVAS